MEPICCISKEAAKVIEDTALRHPYEESGGLLLGIIKGGEYYVLKATDGGPMSEHGAASFTPDLEYITKKIEEEEDKGLVFLGEWHRHPGNMTHPSGGDVHAVRSYFDNNSQLDDYLMIIVNLMRVLIDVHSFLFYRNGNYREIRNVSEKSERHYREVFKPEREGCMETSSSDEELMKKRFPEFQLVENRGEVFWEGHMKQYRVKVFPPTSPLGRFRFDINPPANHRILENLSKTGFSSTTLALMALETFLAKAESERIEQNHEVPKKDEEEEISFPERSLMRLKRIARIILKQPSEDSWYLLPSGKKRLQYEISELNKIFRHVNMYRKSNGQILFRYRSSGYTYILLCPDDYPDSPPEVQKYDEIRGIQMSDSVVEEWLQKYWQNDMTLSDVMRKIVRGRSMNGGRHEGYHL